MVSFPPVSPPTPYTPPSPHPHASHAQPISFFSILSPAQYSVSRTNHLAPRYAVSSIPHYLAPPRSKYSPQHHVLKHPQLPFLPQYQRNDWIHIFIISYKIMFRTVKCDVNFISHYFSKCLWVKCGGF